MSFMFELEGRRSILFPFMFMFLSLFLFLFFSYWRKGRLYFLSHTLFNTLGNLLVDPRAGLLFVDFRDGTILQLSGRARGVWDVPAALALSGVERQIFLNLDCVMRRDNACPLAFDFLGYSPHLGESKANPQSSKQEINAERQIF